jgi:hypothetical protein
MMKIVRPSIVLLSVLAAGGCAPAGGEPPPKVAGTEPTPPPPAPPPAAEVATKLAPPTVPETIKTGEGDVLTAKLSAKGTQNYECQAGEKASFAWKLVGPEADLTDDTGKSVGHHYTGPTWESIDGSKVVGEVKARADAPGGKGVPWLLLKPKSVSGAGVFGKVTAVQRVDTEGGLAPAAGCDAQHTGAKQNIPYRATYYFYSAR